MSFWNSHKPPKRKPLGEDVLNTQAGMDKEFLPAYERSYFNIPEYLKSKFGDKTAEQKSTTQAAGRGAQAFQENRINQIRAKSGNTEAFDPVLHFGEANGSAANAQFQHDLSVANNPGSVPKPKSHFGANNYNPHDYLRGFIQGMPTLTQEEIARETADAPGVVRARFQNDAVRAGTLSDTAQSQASLSADVNAGLVGANESIQHNNDLLNTALTPDYNKNPDLVPQQQTSGTPLTPLPVPNAAGNAPEDAPAGISLLSSQAANRMKQIQSRKIGS